MAKGGWRVFVTATDGGSFVAKDEHVGYIQHFYGFDSPSGLFEDQVQALQSLRDVARAVVGRVHRTVWGSVADEFALPLASWISEDADLLETIVKARENWFERNRGGELAASLARMDCWPELKDMAKICVPPKGGW